MEADPLAMGKAKTNLTVNLQVPRDLLGALDIPESQLASQILESFAVELFRQQRISTGKAAEMLAMSKSDFIQLLNRHQVLYFTESGEELATEVAAIETLFDQV